jgi:predicted RNA polymerase sigma factor
MATGRNCAIDRARRERTLQDRTRRLEADQPTASMDEIDLDDSTITDERPELIFTWHSTLAVEAQVALTLRALGGLTTKEIAADPAPAITIKPCPETCPSAAPGTHAPVHRSDASSKAE